MKTVKIWNIGWLALVSLACTRHPATENPQFKFQNPQVLVANLLANNPIQPRFAPGGREIIFSGRLDGDLWDGIYQVPTIGGLPQKIYGANDDLLCPSFSPDERQVVFCQGLSRQIHLLDIVTKKVTPLPIFGNYPTFLPDGNTILYSGVIDANLRLYDLNAGRQRTLTTSYLRSNYYPLVTPDRDGIVWLENRPQGQIRLNQTDFDALKIEVIKIFHEQILSWSLSPSGQWAIASRANGESFGFKLSDSTTAPIIIQSANEAQNLKQLSYAVCWSPTGQQVTYIGNSVPPYSRKNPFADQGLFRGDLTIANLQWEHLPDAEMLQSPQSRGKSAFPPVENTPRQVSENATPPEPNNPPKIVSNPVETVRQGELYLYRILAVEIDLFDKLNYLLITAPENAELSARTGVLVWLPTDTGRFEFTVAIEDGRTGLDSQTFFVTVLPDARWEQSSFQPSTSQVKASDFAAGMRFRDSNADGFLTAGEKAAIQIDLKPLRDEKFDSLRLQMLYSTKAGEIAAQELVVFYDCQPGRWNRTTIPLEGLAGLRNRRILVRGLLETKYGIQMLPANLIINGRNPEKDD